MFIDLLHHSSTASFKFCRYKVRKNYIQRYRRVVLRNKANHKCLSRRASSVTVVTCLSQNKNTVKMLLLLMESNLVTTMLDGSVHFLNVL